MYVILSGVPGAIWPFVSVDDIDKSTSDRTSSVADNSDPYELILAALENDELKASLPIEQVTQIKSAAKTFHEQVIKKQGTIEGLLEIFRKEYKLDV